MRNALPCGGFLLASALLAAPLRAAELPNVRVHLDPASVRGRCPATVSFTGTISSDRATKVTYHWVLSYGHGPTNQPAHAVSFAKAGSKQVSTSVKVSTSATVIMQLVLPHGLTSNAVKALVQQKCPGSR